MALDRDLTETIRGRYDRISRIYDLMEAVLERLAFSAWRKRVFQRLGRGRRMLEVGVGTGKNFRFYPVDKSITAIDFSPGMLARARRRAEGMRVNVDLHEMDVQNLEFADQTYDGILATFVFCSVPDPAKGLREIGRVSKKGGEIVLLEHVRPGNRLLGKLSDILNLFTVGMMGVHINRDTASNIEKAGLKIVSEENLLWDIVKLFVVRPPSLPARRRNPSACGARTASLSCPSPNRSAYPEEGPPHWH